MRIRGNPSRLEHYTETTLPAIDTVTGDIPSYNRAMTALLDAPSTISLGFIDRSWLLSLELDMLRQVDRRPAAFAYALRQLDRFIPDTPRDRTYLTTTDTVLFDALVDARLRTPGATDAEVYEAALTQITGTPQALADEFRWVLDHVDEQMDDDDVEYMADELRRLIFQIRDAEVYSDQPRLTDEEVAARAFEYLNFQMDDEDMVSADLVRRLGELTSRLGRRRFDVEYSTAFFDALGADATAQLPRALTLASWSDLTRHDGDPTFDIDDALIRVDSALAVASPELDAPWRQTLFAHATDDGALNDAFPLLFKYGQYSAAFAQDAGQLGFDILTGEITVERGVGSPGYPDFDVLATHWEDRGGMLLDAAARTPEAATALLLAEENTNAVTSDDFNHDDHNPDWDVIDQSVRNLIVSGTVWNFDNDPLHSRMAAVNVINGALDEGPGDASDALAPAYGRMALQYLPDFALSPGFGTDLTPTVFDGHISLGGYEGSQFLSLAMHDEEMRNEIFKLRGILDLHLATLGLQGDLPAGQPDWIQQVANINGMVLSGANGENVIIATQLDDAATAYNDNIDFLQSLGMSVIGLKLDLPGPASVLVDRGLQELKDEFLYRDANHLERTGNQNSEATFNAFDHERLVVAEAELFVALRAEVGGQPLSDAQQQTIAHAEARLGQPYVDALRSSATGVDVTPPAVDGRVLQEWAGSTPTTGGFLDVLTYTQAILPNDPRGLW